MSYSSSSTMDFPQLVINKVCQYLSDQDLVKVRQFFPEKVDHYVIWVYLKQSPIELWLQQNELIKYIEQCKKRTFEILSQFNLGLSGSQTKDLVNQMFNPYISRIQL